MTPTMHSFIEHSIDDDDCPVSVIVSLLFKRKLPFDWRANYSGYYEWRVCLCCTI